MFKLATHNGTITLRNPATGGHRTFQVRTQHEESNFAPGQRVVSLLCDGESYRGFGFVTDDGSINVWRKKATPLFAKYADMLIRTDHYAGQHGVDYMFEGRCRVCNRQLTNPESIETGIGPVCAGR